MSLKTKPSNWTLTESAAYSGQTLPLTDGSLTVFKTRSLRHLYRNAEGHCLIEGPIDSLQVIRTQIARGQTHQALLSLQQQLAIEELSEDLASEYAFELARLHLLHGEWQSCIDRMTELLSRPLAQVTKLTALQCRSVAFYELGVWAQALRDIEQVLAIATLFPLAPAGFYATISKAKIKALQGQMEAGERLLETSWAKTIAEPNLDRLLTLCRAEADFKRILHEDSSRWAIAAHAIANEMGDELYAALARFELWAMGDRSPELVTQLNSDLDSHPRVQLLHKTFEPSVAPSTTTIRLLKNSAKRTVGSEVTFADRPTSIDAILVPSRQILVRLSPLDVFVDPKSKKLFQVLSVLGSGRGASKAELFRGIYGDTKYVPHLHDSTLHQMISRARKRTGIKIEMTDGKISADGLWSV